jgi:hypothetical protein
MGSTGDPSGESSLAPCGPVTSSRKRGAGRKGAPATQQDICPALSDLYNAQYRSLFRLAVLLTGALTPMPRRRWCWTPLPRGPACGSARRPRTTPCRTRGDCWVARLRLARHHHLKDGSWRPRGGGGAACCTGTPYEAPRPEGSAVTLALRRLPTGQREATALTLFLDLGSGQAAAAMRVSLATLRRCLAEAGQLRPFCLQAPECQLFRDRQRSPVSQASRAATRSPTGTLAQPGSRGKRRRRRG